ncbi:hypothetical protein SHKM778_02410 [Streptomyces sp. KM77-8]|uniref:Alpha/beta hydrolase n=1 Tax=Streptomyces haneummycinicus TaxID=3074435 RepID=A0AAT9H9B5_9ACTN
MTDDVAAARAAEEESAFSHPPVDPDATVVYGDDPDQLIDFYAPRGPDGPAPVVVVLHGGAWRAPYDRRHVSPFAAFLAGRGSPSPTSNTGVGRGVGRCSGGGAVARHPRRRRRGDGRAARADTGAGAAGRSPADGPHRALRGRAVGAVGRRPACAAGGVGLAYGRARAAAGVVALAPIADFEVADKLEVCGGAVRQLLGGDDCFASRRAYADPAALLPTGIATTLVQGRADEVVPQAVAEAYADAAAKAGRWWG